MLATAAPREGLVETNTVTIANVALWRVHAFNQLVKTLADFMVTNATEITSADTDDERRQELAAAAMSLSLFVHLDGIGLAAATHPDGTLGWYRALVTQLQANMSDLAQLQRNARWRWLREWPYLTVDALVAAGLISVVVAVATR
jgi:hypothetical protein